MTDKRPHVANVADGRVFDFNDSTFEQVMPEASSGGTLTVIRFAVTPGSAPPLHVQSREDEFWVVLSGTVRFWTGANSLGECETRDVGPGGLMYIPRSVPRTFDTVTPSSTVLIGALPGAVEKYFQSVGKTGTRGPEESLSLLRHFGGEALGPPPDIRSTVS
ncbi:MAG TPA: cupin domain-containing protein [Actinocrinis sp.]|jgi:mannose-6-phosphate isomerase-like protein (cupin superfamily)|uniref:cupin domain-containing protein n=1 Tax=Actinocrinis sp. TaxID=1920516 RepID=UPI002DDDB9DE|nr:cupin domain-containing protein [Actinocrinis sp.]HEV3172971.1 cupin domain-containing protein [Actinocrinis sp.]